MAEGAAFVAHGSQSHPSAIALDWACAEQAEAIGFASILTIGEEAVSKAKICHSKGKGKKKAGVAVASSGVDV